MAFNRPITILLVGKGSMINDISDLLERTKTLRSNGNEVGVNVLYTNNWDMIPTMVSAHHVDNLVIKCDSLVKISRVEEMVPQFTKKVMLGILLDPKTEKMAERQIVKLREMMDDGIYLLAVGPNVTDISKHLLDWLRAMANIVIAMRTSQDKQSMYEEGLRYASVPIIYTDEQFNIIRGSEKAREMFGISFMEMKGKSMSTLIHRDHRIDYDTFSDSLIKEKKFDGEISIIDRHGLSKQITVHAKELDFAHGGHFYECMFFDQYSLQSTLSEIETRLERMEESEVEHSPSEQVSI